MNYAEKQRLWKLVGVLICTAIFSIGGFGLVAAVSMTFFQETLPVSIISVLVGILWGAERWTKMAEWDGWVRNGERAAGILEERNKKIAG